MHPSVTDDGDVQLTEDSFRALARSSPWRWRSLHFTRRGGEVETVEAWVTRPDRLVVIDSAGQRHVTQQALGEGRTMVSIPGGATRRPPWQWAADVEPVRRLDGLVAHRPVDPHLHYDDPRWGDYTWVAMLDPVELSAGTIVTDLREGEHRGRSAWRAVVAAVDGYEPRCGCCPLLWGEVSERDESAAGGPAWPAGHPEVAHPIGYEVALDVQTGVVVELTPIGGGRPTYSLDLTIHRAS